jgi:hypothetical protein
MMFYARRFMTACVLLGLLAPNGTARAAESDENAALVYWQAFALLPAVDDELEQLIKDAPTVNLDQRTEKLVQSSNSALVCMRRAVLMPNLQWGLDYSAGPHMVMPHLSKARQMTRYACLHARQQLADENPDGALETLRDTLVMGRHVGSDNVLISLLVQYAVERIVIDTACQELTRFDDQQLDTLTEYLDALPDGGSVTESMKMEKRTYIGWARRVVREATSDQEAAGQLHDIVVPQDQAPDVAGITRTQISQWLDQTAKDYDEILAIVNLPDREFQPRWDSLLARIKQEKSYSSVVLPALKQVRMARDRQAAMWALFRAAVAVERDGAQRLDSINDPFGSGPFGYEKLPAGFRLTSQYKYRDQPVQLTVGPIASE